MAAASVFKDSMTVRMMVGLTTATTLLWCVAVGLSTYVSYRELNGAFDRALREVADNMLPLAVELGQENEADEARVLHHLLEEDHEQLSYQIRNAQGRLVLRANDQFLLAQPGSGAPGYADASGYRTFTLTDPASGLSVTVAEQAKDRWRSLLSSALAMLWPLVLLIPINAVLVVWQVRSAMRPLRRLSSEVSTRGANNLAPIDVSQQPRELKPIARSVAQLLERLRSTLEAERAFTSNSAHELRTPIAAALAQVQRLMAEVHAPAITHRAQQIESSLKKLANLAAKLLELARMDAHAAPTSTPSDVLPILDLLVSDVQAQLQQPSQLHYQKNGALHLMARIDADAFAIAMRNLLENAVQHRSKAGLISIEVHSDGRIGISNAAALLEPETLAQLTQRFLRGEHSGGSGLGLAIVSTIAKQHGATFTLHSLLRGDTPVFEASWVSPA